MGTKWMWIALLSIPLLGGCLEDSFNFGESDVDDTPNSSGTCEPKLSDLSTTAESNSTLGNYFEFTLTYTLYCKASLSSAFVRSKVTNLDAAEDDEDAIAYYTLPVSGSYIEYDTSAQEMVIQYTAPDISATYEFAFKLTDSSGYTSNTVTDEVTYIDIYGG